jgi:hypothetical protein
LHDKIKEDESGEMCVACREEQKRTEDYDGEHERKRPLKNLGYNNR